MGALKYQTAHGFRRGQPVYSALISGTRVYKLATIATGFDGVVGSINSPNQFELVTAGSLDNISGVLAQGQSLYLSTVPGAYALSGDTLVLKGQSASAANVQALAPPAVSSDTTSTASATGFTSASNSGSGAPVFNAATSTASALKFKTITASGTAVLTDNGSSLDINVTIPPTPPGGVDCQAVYDAAILAEASCVGFWKCNEALGAVSLADSKGANPLVVGATAVMGRAGPIPGTGSGCITCDGNSTGTAIAATNVGIPVGSVPVTLECWFRSYDTAGGTNTWIASIGASGTNTLFAIYLNAANVFAYIRDSGGTNVSAAQCFATDQSWHYVAVSYDGATSYKVYFDGALSKTGTTSATVLGAGFVSIGNETVGGVGAYLTGQASRLAVYSTQLSDARIRAHYNLGRIGIAP